jgi:HPt (histidine-containing phosphotransfer) domain-containing protein
VTKVSGSSDKAGSDDSDDYKLPDFLYDLKEIDMDLGLDYCGDGEDYVMALEMFLESAQKKAEEIEKYWEERDIKNVTIKVHALKSSARSIGALNLSEFAARLEKAGSSDDTQTLEKELSKMLSEYRQLARNLEPLKYLDLQDK